MNKKAKGTVAERDLLHKFWKEGIPAIRVAGSGSMRYPSPDIIAGTPLRKFVIECKHIVSERLYVPKNEIEDLRSFGKEFGAETFLAVKFDKWYFLILDDLRETEASFSINTEEVKIKGILFEELMEDI